MNKVILKIIVFLLAGVLFQPTTAKNIVDQLSAVDTLKIQKSYLKKLRQLSCNAEFGKRVLLIYLTDIDYSTLLKAWSGEKLGSAELIERVELAYDPYNRKKKIPDNFGMIIDDGLTIIAYADNTGVYCNYMKSEKRRQLVDYIVGEQPDIMFQMYGTTNGSIYFSVKNGAVEVLEFDKTHKMSVVPVEDFTNWKAIDLYWSLGIPEEERVKILNGYWESL
ncbi:MAG: hypothetical protein PUB21_07810 [Bacteroidales bacterium]|nr:hypothetical protein [Bacteroidales bacterium]